MQIYILYYFPKLDMHYYTNVFSYQSCKIQKGAANHSYKQFIQSQVVSLENGPCTRSRFRLKRFPPKKVY